MSTPCWSRDSTGEAAVSAHSSVDAAAAMMNACETVGLVSSRCKWQVGRLLTLHFDL